jgi:hypothetical protein
MRATAAALAAALVLAVVHVVTPSLRRLDGTPRSVWLSLAGGVSVAYVFVHLLPELAEGQQHVSRVLEGPDVGAVPAVVLGFAERHVYLIALVGLAAFYGLERLAVRSRGEQARAGGPADEGDAAAPATDGSPDRRADRPAEATGAGVFWIHMTSFALYNALIGYLLVHGQGDDLRTLALFTTAMALHFVVTDFGLNAHHQHRYHQVGRWLLVAAVAAGWGAGVLAELPEAAIAVLTAFLAGGVILNVLKEEVPSERQSRFWAFATGLTVYAVLLLAV